MRSTTDTAVRVLFCTAPGSYSDLVLDELIAAPELQLVGVVESTRILRKKGWPCWDAALLLRRTSLRYAGYLWLVTSLYTLLRRLAGRDRVGEYLRAGAVPVLATRDINAPEGCAFVEACRPDLLLSAHFNQLIGPRLLALPPKGCLNIHPGALPAYRGVDPVLYALSRGERRLGVTLHLQDATFDTGAVLACRDVPVRPGESVFSLNCRLFRHGAALFLDLLREGGAPAGGSAEEGPAGYDSWPDRSALGALRRGGRRLLGAGDFLRTVLR
jgi:methionyl-tRNA formyltransferase